MPRFQRPQSPEAIRRAVERILVVLDTGTRRSVRARALMDLSAGFPEMAPVLWPTFCAQPLSSMGDAYRLPPHAARIHDPPLREFFVRLSRVQPYAYALHHAWEWVPESLFRPPWERSEVSVLLGGASEVVVRYLETGHPPGVREELILALQPAFSDNQIPRGREILACWLDRAVDIYLQNGAPA